VQKSQWDDAFDNTFPNQPDVALALSRKAVSIAARIAPHAGPKAAVRLAAVGS
jgi:hypothetical protein